MDLYTKEVSPKGKITYKPYMPPTNRIEMELTNAEVCSMVAALGICCLYGFEAHLPDHSAISRKVRALEVAIGDVAALNRDSLSEKHMDAVQQAWGAALVKLQEVLAT